MFKGDRVDDSQSMPAALRPSAGVKDHPEDDRVTLKCVDDAAFTPERSVDGSISSHSSSRPRLSPLDPLQFSTDKPGIHDESKSKVQRSSTERVSFFVGGVDRIQRSSDRGRLKVDDRSRVQGSSSDEETFWDLEDCQGLGSEGHQVQRSRVAIEEGSDSGDAECDEIKESTVYAGCNEQTVRNDNDDVPCDDDVTCYASETPITSTKPLRRSHNFRQELREVAGDVAAAIVGPTPRPDVTRKRRAWAPWPSTGLRMLQRVLSRRRRSESERRDSISSARLLEAVSQVREVPVMPFREGGAQDDDVPKRGPPDAGSVHTESMSTDVSSTFDDHETTEVKVPLVKIPAVAPASTVPFVWKQVGTLLLCVGTIEAWLWFERHVFLCTLQEVGCLFVFSVE